MGNWSGAITRSIGWVLIFIFPAYAYSCYCTETPIGQRFDESDFVYLGQVQSSVLKHGVITNKLSILETFKAKPDNLTVLNSLFSDDMCSSHMVVGYKYVVFGKFGKTPKISSCSYTRSLGIVGEKGIDQLNKKANKKIILRQ